MYTAFLEGRVCLFSDKIGLLYIYTLTNSVPSQAKIYEDLVKRFKAASTRQLDSSLWEKKARFLNEGIDLERQQ